MLKTQQATSYTAFGCNISSDYPLPELKPARCENTETDLTIKTENLSALWLDLADTDTSYYYIKENFCMVRVPNVAIYKIENGSVISVSPFDGSDEDQIRLYILGTCMGVALMQRKVLPIHGSAIAINGKAYAIVGDSGAGKSTLASAFINRGFSLLTDDVIAVKMSEDNVATVIPSYPQQKLWQESLDRFGVVSNQFKPIYDRETKFAIPVPDDFYDKPLPLAGIFELWKTDQQDINIRSVQKLERFPVLYYHTYRNFMVERSGLMNWHFAFSANIVNKIDFYRITRPNSRFTAHELVDSILDVIKYTGCN